MNPDGAVSGDAIDGELVFREGVFNFGGALKSVVGLKHVVAGLRSSGTGALGVGEKIIEGFRAMLCAFDGGMVDGICHKVGRVKTRELGEQAAF